MKESLEILLVELEAFGRLNDEAHLERPKRMLNITRETGEFLKVSALAMNAKHILEIGTSNGYSTLWLAQAAKVNQGEVTTIEYSEYKVALAAQNFEKSGLAQYIFQKNAEAGSVLNELPDQSVDLLFLDSERNEYVGWWPNIKRVLKKRGLLIVDNATSHALEVAPLIDLIKANSDFSTSLIPVGNGEFLAIRE